MVLKKGPWSLEEDWKLTAYINTYGIWNWRKMPEAAGLSRCGKSCRLRWMNYLDPQIKRGNFTCEEDETIARMHKVLGNKWSEIASAVPGRSDNEIKNHWHTRLSKRLKRAKTEQSQASSTTIDDNKTDLAELDRLLPKNDFPDSTFSSSPIGYGSPRGTSTIGTTASVETCATEEKSEASSNPSMICENNLYWENFQLMFDESGLLHPFGDQFWNPEPTCPSNFYGNLSYDLRESLAQPEDIDGILIDPIFQI